MHVVRPLAALPRVTCRRSVSWTDSARDVAGRIGAVNSQGEMTIRPWPLEPTTSLPECEGNGNAEAGYFGVTFNRILAFSVLRDNRTVGLTSQDSGSWTVASDESSGPNVSRKGVPGGR